MGWTSKATGTDEAFAAAEDQIARAMTATMADVGGLLKEDLRQQVRGAGLGERMAKTWQGRIYPSSGRSLDPAALVWSRAAKVIDAFDRGATIYPLNGHRFLALPTSNVPRKAGASRGRAGIMTPPEVEAAFGQDLIIRPNLKRRGCFLAFVNAVLGKTGKARPATGRRLAKGRVRQLVLMFNLVPSVRQPKLLDIDGAIGSAVGRFDQALDANWR